MEWPLMRLKSLSDRTHGWLVKYADSVHAKFWLFFFSFTEASFFPLPPSTLLIAILTSDQTKRWAYYSALTTVASVLGGILGYIIGLFFYDTIGVAIIEAYEMTSQINEISSLFDRHAFLAVFTASFTPIPYKVFTIASGFFKINLLTFIIASILGRGLRFFLVGMVVKVFGERVGHDLFKYFNLMAIVFVLALLLYFTVKLLIGLL